jgi:molybdopterin synthase sulfur carrier subunit
MGVSVRIPTPLRSQTNGQAEVLVEGKTVKEIIDNLENAYTGIKERVCDEQGNLRRFVNLYLNDEDIRFLQNLDTEVGDGDGLSIVPAISGG